MDLRKRSKREEEKRHKKEKALKSDVYKLNIEELEQRGLTESDIQMIYDRCHEKKQSMIAKDTLTFKLIELLNYFDERNKGLKENDEGFISIDDIIYMIMKNPRMINSDIKNNIIAKCQILTDKKGTTREANMAIKTNPGIFRKTEQAIREGK